MCVCECVCEYVKGWSEQKIYRQNIKEEIFEKKKNIKTGDRFFFVFRKVGFWFWYLSKLNRKR